METVIDFIFLGSKTTVDCDCGHKIKRYLLIGRKAMTNLDSILKRKDITLLTKVRIVKAMFFPVVVYRWWELDHKEGWALKNWCFWTWCCRRLLRVPWITRRSNQSSLKALNLEYSLERLVLRFQFFGHLMQRASCTKDYNSCKDWGQ